MKAVLFVVLGFILGLVTGWLIFRCRDIPSVSTNEQSQTKKNESVWPPDVAQLEPAARMGVPIRFKRAWELYRNYKTGVHINRPKTEAVIHDIKGLQAYLDKVKALAAEAEADGCKECIPGIAFYFGGSYNDNYLLKQKGKNSYLFKENNTVVLMPYFFKEDNKTFDFYYVEEGDELKRGKQSISVKRISQSWDPLSQYDPRLNWADQKMRTKLKNFFEDPEGFDLGHTKP